MDKRAKLILKGGLGNQLFQLSRALTLADHFAEIYLVDDFENHSVSRPIHIKTLIESSKVLPKLDSLSLFEKLRLKLFRIFSSRIKNLSFFLGCNNDEIDSQNNFISRFYSTILFDGYWQVAEFVSMNENLIYETLHKFVNSHSLKSGNSKSEIDVLLHVRGGDYVNNKLNAEAFGNLSAFYYSKVLEDLDFINLSVATDDLEWLSKLEFKFQVSKILNPKDFNEWDVIASAMSAKIFVSANSSLSWWAAFMASFTGTKVIIPSPWFKRDPYSQSRNYYRFDLAQSHWK